MKRGAGQDDHHLRVDPIACDGIGICAHLAPALVTVDSWGFPIVGSGVVGRRGNRAARQAVRACPRQALTLTDEKDAHR